MSQAFGLKSVAGAVLENLRTPRKFKTEVTRTARKEHHSSCILFVCFVFFVVNSWFLFSSRNSPVFRSWSGRYHGLAVSPGDRDCLCKRTIISSSPRSRIDFEPKSRY
jgi:hypothetical protein